MAEPDSNKGVQMNEGAAENYTGDRSDTKKLIENGDGPKEPGAEEYKEVEPLQLDVPSDPKKTSDGLKVIIISCIVFAVGVTVALIVTIYCAPPQIELHGAVSCDDPRCSAIGVDLLKAGGSAVDAAIGVLFCLSVVQPASSGLGGGGFMMYRDNRNQLTETFNFRETAPQGNDPTSLDSEELTSNDTITGAFVGVPGFLKGMEEAHQAHGKLSWSALIEPSIALARAGYNVSEDTAYHLKAHIDCTQAGLAQSFRDVYCVGGNTVKKGAIVKLGNYSKLLQWVSEQGAAFMYTGEGAQEIVDTVNAAGGSMEMTDFSGYTVDRNQPITANFRDYSIEALEAPSGGPLVLLMLNVLGTYNLTVKDRQSALYYHRFMEAAKFANAISEYLGDPVAHPDVLKHSDQITGNGYAKTVAGEIDDKQTFGEDHYFLALGLEVRRKRAVKHTTHVSVIGPSEDQVTVTNSLNSNFGSRVVTPSGLILNDQLRDFDSPSQPHSNPNNQMVGGARATSHMSPTIAHSRTRPCGLRLATGAVGGWSITSEIASSLINLLAFNLTLEESIEAPRIYYDRHAAHFRYEEGLAADIVQELQTLGHNLTVIPRVEARSTINAVMKVNETVSAHADTRRGGVATVF